MTTVAPASRAHGYKTISRRRLLAPIAVDGLFVVLVCLAALSLSVARGTPGHGVFSLTGPLSEARADQTATSSTSTPPASPI